MADCYYHGYSGGSGPCRGCERDERENVKNEDSTFHYEPIPMEITDKFNGEKYKKPKE